MISLGSYYEYWKFHKEDLLKFKEFFPDKVTPHSIDRHPVYIALNNAWSFLKTAPRNANVDIFIRALLSSQEFINIPEHYKICIMSALAYQLKQIEEDWYEDLIADMYNTIFNKKDEDKISSAILCYQPYMDALTKRINNLSDSAIKALHTIKLLYPNFKVLNRTIGFFEEGKNFFINITSASGGSLNLKCNLYQPTQKELYDVYNECYSILLDPPEEYNSRLGYNVIRLTVINDITTQKPIINEKYNLWDRKSKLKGHADFLAIFNTIQSQYECRDFEAEVIY